MQQGPVISLNDTTRPHLTTQVIREPYLQAFAAPLLQEGALVEVSKGLRHEASIQLVVAVHILLCQILGSTPLRVQQSPAALGQWHVICNIRVERDRSLQRQQCSKARHDTMRDANRSIAGKA